MSALLFLLGVILLLTVISGIYIFYIGFVRSKDVAWLIEDEVRKTPFGQYYPHIAAADKWIREHETHGISIQSRDGLTLHALWIPVKHAKATILLVHGYRSTYLVDFGPALDYYHCHGYNLLIPDQRAHGNSEGIFITFGVKEADDMRRWVDYHNTHFGMYPMILNGLSMGATTVIYMADKQLPDNVKGIIADCGFTSPAAILSAVFRRVTHLPALPALCVTELIVRLFAGISLWQCDTRRILAKSMLPIVMIHGKEDGFVPCTMTIQAYAVCASQKHLLLVDGAEHGVSFFAAKDAYISLIEAFMDEVLDI
jgi:pimeloyl-ACP methyl ester carboxylesterase